MADKRFPRVRPGDPVKANDWNEVMTALEASLNLTVSGSLTLLRTQNGRHLTGLSRTPIRVRLKEPLYRSRTAVPATVVEWEPTNSTWIDTDREIEVSGEFVGLYHFAGTLCQVEFSPTAGPFGRYFVVGPTGESYVRGTTMTAVAKDDAVEISLACTDGGSSGSGGEPTLLRVWSPFGCVPAGKMVGVSWNVACERHEIHASECDRSCSGDDGQPNDGCTGTFTIVAECNGGFLVWPEPSSPLGCCPSEPTEGPAFEDDAYDGTYSTAPASGCAIVWNPPVGEACGDPDPGPCGNCLHEATSIGVSPTWTVVSNNCTGGCGCNCPDVIPTVIGQRVTTNCSNPNSACASVVPGPEPGPGPGGLP